MSKPTYEVLEKRIKDLEKTEQELYLQKTYFEKLFNSAPEAISLQDDNDIVIDVNEEFTKIFGYSSEESIGKPINDLVLPKEIGGWLDLRGLSSAKDLVLPEKIGGSLDLNGLSYTEREKIRKEYGK